MELLNSLLKYLTLTKQREIIIIKWQKSKRYRKIFEECIYVGRKHLNSFYLISYIWEILYLKSLSYTLGLFIMFKYLTKKITAHYVINKLMKNLYSHCIYSTIITTWRFIPKEYSILSIFYWLHVYIRNYFGGLYILL